MPLVRYPYLKENGIVNDRVALARAITNLGFPKPLELGTRSIAWNLSEVEEWVAARPRRVPKVSQPAPRKRPAAIAEAE